MPRRMKFKVEGNEESKREKGPPGPGGVRRLGRPPCGALWKPISDRANRPVREGNFGLKVERQFFLANLDSRLSPGDLVTGSRRVEAQLSSAP
jgi:hypothetical protein